MGQLTRPIRKLSVPFTGFELLLLPSRVVEILKRRPGQTGRAVLDEIPVEPHELFHEQHHGCAVCGDVMNGDEQHMLGLGTSQQRRA